MVLFNYFNGGIIYIILDMLLLHMTRNMFKPGTITLIKEYSAGESINYQIHHIIK